MVVALQPSPSEEVRPFMILTLWPRQQKPKPTIRELALETIKVFRAVLLKEHEAEDGSWHYTPTDLRELYGPQHVYGILDVLSHDVFKSRIELTPESTAAIQRLQEWCVPDGKKNARQRRKKRSLDEQVVAEAEEMIPPDPTAKKSRFGDAVKQSLSKKAKVCEEREYTAEDFRRSHKGRSNIVAMMSLLKAKDSIVFPETSLFDASGWCTMPGHSELSWKAFVGKISFFFEYKYWQPRSPQHYGEHVYNDLHRAWTELCMAQPSHERFRSIVKEVFKVLKPGTIRY